MEQPGKAAIKQEIKTTEKANVEIRDNMAIERTRLANERTFLAYIRTAMALVLAGFSLMNFFRENFYVWVGVIFIPLGIAAGIIGVIKYIKKRQTINSHKEAYTPTSQIHAEVSKVDKSRL